jgi:TatD DNase family protein
MPQSEFPSLIDIGANLGHDSFDHDREQIILEAKAAGLSAIIVTGTSVASSEKAAELAAQHPGYLFSTAGVHPHDASGFTADTPDKLRALAQLSQVVAIGETGLDFYRNFSPPNAQEAAFAEQLALAVALQLPVFLHQRDAHARFLALLTEQRDGLRHGVVHCFTGSREDLHDYLDLDMYIGITGWVCDERRGQHVQELLADIPLNRLLLETDAPYLMPRNIAPKPPGRRNVPANLPWVLQKVAACLKMSGTQLANLTRRNAFYLFNL